MHELSIASSVIEIVSRHAAGRRVLKVQLRIGHLRQVVPSALRFSFELVAQGTTVEGAVLEIEEAPAIGRCRKCGVDSRQDAFPFQCTACDSFDLEVAAGDDMLVESLELEDAEPEELTDAQFA